MHSKRRLPITRWLRAVTVALAATTAACERATAPSSLPLDAGTTLADYQALQQLLASEGFAGLQALGGRTPMSASTAIAAARALPALAGSGNGPTGDRSGRQYVLALFRAATAQGGDGWASTFARTIISDRHLGRTLVYDAGRDQYVIDAGRTGAPANGVRFIVYETDASGRPIPGREIGHADLLDEGAGTGEAIALRLLLVTRGITRLDYRTRVEVGGTTASVDVSGFAVDGPERLDFTVKLRGRTTNGAPLLDADFDLALAPRNFSVTGQVRGVQDGRDGDGTVALTARHNSNTLRVSLTGSDGQLAGGITWNGTPYISISGPAADPILRGPTGQPLTPQEALVARAVVHLADDVFDLVEELVEPVEGLVLLGWLL